MTCVCIVTGQEDKAGSVCLLVPVRWRQDPERFLASSEALRCVSEPWRHNYEL